jgi:hypothetical protein
VGHAVSPASIHRLDQLAVERLGDELNRAFAALAADGRVYVLRRVAAASTLRPTADTDLGVADRWGRDLAAAVARALTHDPGDGDNLVRFESETSFVAAFVADSVTGDAWRHWYYGAFARHRHLPPHDAIAAVLAEHSTDLGAILAELARRGLLERLLATVDLAVALPSREPASDPSAMGDVAAWRPLVAAALQLLEALGAPAPAATMSDLAQRWAGTGGAVPDWRDPGALADAVTAVVVWLVGTTGARPADPPDVEEIVAAAGGLQWLDRGRLGGSLAAALHRDEAGAAPRPAVATPRQRALLAVLLRVVRDLRPPVDSLDRQSLANAVRIRAALAQLEPGWGDDPVAAAVIDRVLAAWAELAASQRPDEVLAAVAAGDPERVISVWWSGRREAPPIDGHPLAGGPARLCALAAMGEPAAQVVAELAGSGPPTPGDGFASPVAGVLLLWRALLDVRLHDLADRHRYPPTGSAFLLAELGCRWVGADASPVGRLDPAVVLLAGPGAPATVAELEEAWAAVPAGLHATWGIALEELAARHKVVAPDTDPVERTAEVLVRIWARWLRGFERSATGYLLEQLVRRPGHITVAPTALTVRLARRPLDTVLEIAGYLRPLEALPGLLAKRVEFVVEELR